MASVALASCAAHPHGDAEHELTLGALAREGIDASLQVWTDERVDWDAFDLVIVRTTWDYQANHAAFLDWIARCPRIENTATMLAWNSDKRYLDDLGRRGVPVVPTRYVTSIDQLVIPDADRFVVKPTIGAGATGVERFNSSEIDRATAHIQGLLERGFVAMVQPYLEFVESANEIGIVMIDGEPTHAIEKLAVLNAPPAQRSTLLDASGVGDRTPTTEELALAALTLRAAADCCDLDAPMLYCRVDLIPSIDGPVVLELEAIEPSLYFERTAGAADLFAEAVTRRLDAR
jgi:glutathione synthase/RimK-type ligase-like ATP-grasp enzyme